MFFVALSVHDLKDSSLCFSILFVEASVVNICDAFYCLLFGDLLITHDLAFN